MTELVQCRGRLGAFANACWVASAVLLLAFALLVAHHRVYLQVVRHEQLSEQAEGNRTAIVPYCSQSRFLIVDRNGIVLASNYSAYTLEITPVEGGATGGHHRRAGAGGGNSAAPTAGVFATDGGVQNFESLPIRTRLTDTEVARLPRAAGAFRAWRSKRLFRNYPLG